MSRSACPRQWEAQAIADGRLDSDDRHSFERHAQVCVRCGAEAQALAALHGTMSALQPRPLTELELRRLRGKVLRAAAARRVRPGSRRPVWMAAAAALLTAALGIGVAMREHRRLPPRPTAVAGARPSFDIVNVDGAVFTTGGDDHRALVTLSEGSAAFHVDRVSADQRFLLVLPDGEIEVQGTRFLVTVRGQRTRAVEVTEGVVALRLVGESERRLSAGTHWMAKADVASAEPVQGPESAEAERHARTDMPAAEPATSRGKTELRNETPQNVDGAAAPTYADARAEPVVAAAPQPQEGARPRVESERFAAAISAFQAGDFVRADDELASFIDSFPADPRAEDASFLRIVAHLRMGDRPGAVSLARRYLETFPHGLRRMEALEVSRTSN